MSASSHHQKVAAIVVNWNSLALLRRCFEALSQQTQSFDRVVVVDNGSGEDLQSLVWTGSGVFTLLMRPQNEGFAAANNVGMHVCNDCEWIALVNPDAFLETNWLEEMLHAARRHSESASFASRLVMDRHHDYLDGVGDAYHVSGLVWREGHGGRAADLGLEEREVFSACAAAALYRREALLRTGGFDEDFFCYAEDVDLGFRLRLLGYTCWYVPKAVACHVGSVTTGGQHSDFAIYHGHRNLVWVFVKNMPSALFWLFLPLHLLMNLLVVVWFILHGQTKTILRAKLDALRGLRRMWAKRKKIQLHRVIAAETIFWVMDKRLLPLRRTLFERHTDVN